MAVLVSLLSASVPGQAGTEHVPDPAPVFGHSLKTQDAKTCKWVEPQNVIGLIVLVLIHIVLPFLFPLFLFQFTLPPPCCYFRLLFSPFLFLLPSLLLFQAAFLHVSILACFYLYFNSVFSPCLIASLLISKPQDILQKVTKPTSDKVQEVQVSTVNCARQIIPNCHAAPSLLRGVTVVVT